MKIHQLPLGARFEYEGDEYVKTGPMFATGKGGQRLIPKYAQLRPLDGQPPAPAAKGGMLARATVADAFAEFYATCSRLVPASAQAELDAARERFLKAL